MSRFLVHVATGPDNPTRAALAFLVARTVLDEGHELALFVAGDAVHLLTREVSDQLVGVGTGELAAHLAAIDGRTTEVFYSGMSARARGISQDQIVLSGAQPAMPPTLVELSAGADTVLCY